MDLLISGGVVLLAIALLSIYAVYLFLVRFAKLSRERLDGDALMARVNAAVRDRDLELALDACEQHGGPISRTLHAALLRLPYGRQAVEAAFQDASLQEEQRLTRGLRPLATIAQVAPLLGLLGTVPGMLIAFGEISGSGTGNPALLAGGIGQALVTTAAGLIVAIPTLVGQSFLASKVDTILLEIDRRREELMANVVQAVAARKDRDDQRPAGEAAPTAAAGTAATAVRRTAGATTVSDVPAAAGAGAAARGAGEAPSLFEQVSIEEERPLPPRVAPVGPSMAARAAAAGSQGASGASGTSPARARLQVQRDPGESEG